MLWPVAVVLLSAIMLYEDAEVARHMGTGSDAAAWGMLQAAGMIEQAVIATLAAGAGLFAALAGSFLACVMTARSRQSSRRSRRFSMRSRRTSISANFRSA
jgi:hypothetical protein